MRSVGRHLGSRSAALILSALALLGAVGAQGSCKKVDGPGGGMRTEKAGARLARMYGCSPERIYRAPWFVMVKDEGKHTEKARLVRRGDTSQWLMHGYRIRYWCREG